MWLIYITIYVLEERVIAKKKLGWSKNQRESICDILEHISELYWFVLEFCIDCNAVFMLIAKSDFIISGSVKNFKECRRPLEKNFHARPFRENAIHLRIR